MPGIAHLITGALFGALLYNASPRTYTKKHALIFAIMCYVGPDFAHFLSISNFDHRLGHSIFGWPIYCLWMVPIFTFLTRFTFDYAHHQLKDEGPFARTKLAWWQVYLVMVAGGLFHFTVDMAMETKEVFGTLPVSLDVLFFRETLQGFALIPGASSIFEVVPYFIVVALYYFYNREMQRTASGRSFRSLNLVVFALALAYLVFLIIFGNLGGENDLGAMSFVGLFFFLPFALNLLARYPEVTATTRKAPEAQDHVATESPTLAALPKRQYNATRGVRKLNIVIGFCGFCGTLLFVLAVGSYGFLQGLLFEVEFIADNAAWLAPLVLVVAACFFIDAILLHRRHLLGQAIARYLFLLTSIILIPLVMWGFLREKEVLDLF